MVEIYNETIRDLLGNGGDDVKHEIRLVSPTSTETYVTDLTLVTVTQCSEVSMSLLAVLCYWP
jgi:hypothetical protein